MEFCVWLKENDSAISRFQKIVLCSVLEVFLAQPDACGGFGDNQHFPFFFPEKVILDKCRKSSL